MKVILDETKYVAAQQDNYEYLIKGKEYVVYGITIAEGQIYYYICDEMYSYYPMTKPSSFFKVINAHCSRYWIFSLCENPEKFFKLMFPEWINESMFVTNLVDGEDREVKIFKAYKEAMDLEFPDSSITETAQIGDDEWLICPVCIDAWKSKNDLDALVICSECLSILNNPRFKNVYANLNFTN